MYLRYKNMVFRPSMFSIGDAKASDTYYRKSFKAYSKSNSHFAWHQSMTGFGGGGFSIHFDFKDGIILFILGFLTTLTIFSHRWRTLQPAFT